MSFYYSGKFQIKIPNRGQYGSKLGVETYCLGIFRYYVDMTFCIKPWRIEGTTSKTIGEERCANTKLPRCLPLGQFLQLNDIGQTFS